MERTGQSSLGIASLIISGVGFLATFLLIIIAGILETSSPGGMNEESIEAAIVGLFIIGFLGLELIAIGLGIAGIFQKAKSRVTAIIGTSIATATIIITTSLILIGTAMS